MNEPLLAAWEVSQFLLDRFEQAYRKLKAK